MEIYFSAQTTTSDDGRLTAQPNEDFRLNRLVHMYHRWICCRRALMHAGAKCARWLSQHSRTHINRSCESQSPNETRSENKQNCQTKANAAMKRCLICFYSLWNLCEWHCVAVHMRWLSVHIKRIERKCPISQMSIASHDKWKSLFAFRISDPIGDRFAWMRRFR